MEQNLNPSNPPQNPIPPISTDTSPGAPNRKRRIFFKVAAALLVILLLLVLAAPTLLSTRPVLSIILGQVNKRLNGKVDVSSLSLGWFSGVKAEGVRVFDATNAQIAEVDHAAVPLPLWKAVFGKISLGEVVVDGFSFDARYDDQGRLNFAMLAKQSPNESDDKTTSSTSASAESKPSKLPDVSGHIKLTNCHGTISKPGQPTVYLTQLSGDVQIPDINQPITDQLNATVHVGDQKDGTIASSGTASVIKGNEISLGSAEIHQKLNVADLDLQAAKPFIPNTLGVDTLNGVLAAQFNIDVTAGKDAVVDAIITSQHGLSIGGQILKGDTFHTDTFTAQIPQLKATFADGLDHWQSGRFKLGNDAASPPTVFKIDQGQITLGADIAPQALLNLLDENAPASSGQLALAANFDLGKIIPQLKNTVPTTKGVSIQSGTYAQTVKIEITPDKGTGTVTTDITNVVATQVVPGSAAKTITLAPIHVAADLADVGGGNVLGGLRDMHLSLQSKFANGDFKGTTIADLSGNLTADLNAMQEEFSQIVDFGGTTLAGNLDAKISDDGQLTVAPYQSAIKASATLTGLKYGDKDGPRLDQPLVQINLSTNLHGSSSNSLESVKDFLLTLKTGDATNPKINIVAEVPSITLSANTIAVDQADIKAGFATIAVTGVKVSTDAKSSLEKLQSAHLQFDVPDLKAATDAMNSFALPTKETEKKSEITSDKSTPPLEWTSGKFAMTGDISHDGPTLKINVSNLSGTDMAFKRGDIAYKVKPFLIKLVAAVQASGEKSAVDQLQITQLDGNLGIATLSMPTPIAITNLSASPTASGAIKLVGNLTDLTQLLAAFQGEKTDAYPYRGDYTLTENIGTQKDTVSLKGGLQIAKFQTMNGNTSSFSEDLIDVGDDVALTTTSNDEWIAINSVTAAMKSSGAVNISLKGGTIHHLHTGRDLDLHPSIDYDLAKLWPVIQPMMGDKYKTLKIAGQYQKQFNVTGSYPANEVSTVAIKTLNADGDLSVQSFDYDGLTMQNFVVPFTLSAGKLMTVYAGKPAGQNTAAPATANGGKLDLSDLTVDLTQDPPRLTTPVNRPVIAGVTINPIFANTFLAKVINNPLFATAQEATGLVDLTIVDCTDLPLGDLVKQKVAANTGKIDLDISMTKLRVGLPTDALQSVLKQNDFEANVKDATVSIAKGISTQHIKFMTGTYTLGFDGTVRLSDQAFTPMTLSFPFGIIASKTHLTDPNIAKYLPDTLNVPVEGTVNAPKYRFEKVFPRAIADASAKALAGGLFGKNKKGDDNDANDPIGGLLDKLSKKKKQ